MIRYTINVIIAFFVLSFPVQSQKSAEKIKRYNNNDFVNYRINGDQYNFWWHRYETRWFKKGDTLPYFVDETDYKGTLNYGINFSLTDHRNFNFTENFKIHKLKVNIKKCKFSTSDSILEIQGNVEGGRIGPEWRGVKNNVDIFIGKKVDTTSVLYFNYLIKREDIKITQNNKEVTSHIPLDTFPSFYMKNYEHYITNSGDKRVFNIKTKIRDKNTLLVFGLTNTFTEIFDLGKMLFTDTNGSESKEIKAKTINREMKPVYIIRNNVQEKNVKNALEIIQSEYHKITEKAENLILRKQYGKANVLYTDLQKRYNILFARDIHNAVRTSILSRNYKEAIKWCEKLVLKGVPKSYFDAEIFARLKKNQLWSNFIINYDNLREKHVQHIDTSLVNKLHELVDIDQQVYRKNTTSKIDPLELRNTTIGVDTKLIELIREKGFPSEEKIGVQMYRDTVIERHPNYYVLIRHSHQSNSSKLNEIKSILYESSKTLEYDGVRDKLQIFKSNGACYQVYKGFLYVQKSCQLNSNQVNKISYIFDNKNGFIIDSANFIIIPYEPSNEQEDELYLKENFKKVKKMTDDWFWYEK